MKKKNVVFALTTLMMLAGCGNVSTGSEGKPTDTTTVATTENTATTTTNTTTTTKNTTTTETVDTALANAKKEALDYLNTIDTFLYRDPEKSELEETITALKASIEAEDATVESIQASITSFKAYLAELKTDAQYQEEEEQARLEELQAAKASKVLQATLTDINQYRKDEKKAALALQDAEIKKINALTTKEEVDAYSLDSYFLEVSKLKTNAEYTMDEMVAYHDYPSKWALVNEHGYTYTRDETAGIKTKEVGYIYEAANTYNDVTIEFTVNAPADTGFVSVFLANNSDNNDGINGYVFNINVDTSQNHQYVQVYRFEDAFGSYNNQEPPYIGGWTYEQTGNKVLGTSFRFEKKGSSLNIYDAKEYAKNPETATCIPVDLTTNGKPLFENLHIGVMNWDGRDATVKLDKIITDDDHVVDGVETAKFYSNNYINTINYSLYRDAEKTAITAKKDELVALYTAEGTTYQNIIDKMNELKAFIAAQKTDKDYQAEEDAKNLPKVKEKKIASMFHYEENAYTSENAKKVLAIYNEAKEAVNALNSIDEVNAFDFTPYQTRIDAISDNVSDLYDEMQHNPTQSTWDLIQQHAAQWQYDGRRMTVNSVAWQLGHTDYSDVEIVLNMNSTENIDTDNGDFRSFIVRGTPNKEHPDAMSGYVINFVNVGEKQFIQVWYIGYFWGYSNGPAEYLGGVVSKTPINDTTFRVSFVGNNCKIYYENKYNIGGENTPDADIDLSKGGSLPTYTSGKLGAVCWANSPENVKVANLDVKQIIRR